MSSFERGLTNRLGLVLSLGILSLGVSGCKGSPGYILPSALGKFSCAHRPQPAISVKDLKPGQSFDAPDDVDGNITALPNGQMSVDYLSAVSSTTIVRGAFSQSETGSSLDPPGITETSYGPGRHTIVVEGSGAPDFVSSQQGSLPNTTTIVIACR